MSYGCSTGRCYDNFKKKIPFSGFSVHSVGKISLGISVSLSFLPLSLSSLLSFRRHILACKSQASQAEGSRSRTARTEQRKRKKKEGRKEKKKSVQYSRKYKKRRKEGSVK